MERPTVLIVAANTFHLALMADLLEANDIKTVRARGAADAILTLDIETPMLAILDLALPNEDQQRVMEALRACEETQGIPIMAVADRGQREMFASVLAACEGGALEKPIDTGMFPRRVIQEIRRYTTGMSSEALL